MMRIAAYSLLGIFFAAIASCGNHAPVVDDSTPPGRDLNTLGLYHFHNGNLTAATDYFEQALAESRAVDFIDGQARALYNLALVDRVCDRGDTSIRRLEIAQELFERLDAKDGIARCMAVRATLRAARGELGAARVLLEKALQIAGPSEHAEIRTELAMIHLELKNLDAARTEAEIAVRSARSNYVLADALYNLAKVLLAQNDLAAASLTLERALSFDQKAGRRWQIAASLELLATISERLGEPARALEYRDRARGVRNSLNDNSANADAVAEGQ